MKQRLCIFGEVLFDYFPDGKRVLGGAPFNVAWHLQAFGLAPYFISRIGNDAEGETVRNAMRDWGMITEGLQTDKHLPTGRVGIEFVDNEPHYNIVHPCAYDTIETLSDRDSQPCDLLYHGSLALRDEISKHTVTRLISMQSTRVFVDVNLRPPWYQREQVQQMVRDANWIKLNIDEMNELYPSNEIEAAKLTRILEENRLEGIILTRGSEGASVMTANGDHFTVSPEANIKLVDTVGAGDAFTSVMILGLTNDWPLDVTLQRAQEFASALVGQRGATVSDPNFYHFFIQCWNKQS